jgi:sec-independent protein translocase protein TatA
MGLEAPSHWIIIAVIVIALFGYKKMPDAARSVGRSLRIFKGELTDLTDHAATGPTEHAATPVVRAEAAPAGLTPDDAPSVPPVVTATDVP